MLLHGGYTRGIDGHLFTVPASPNDTGHQTRCVELLTADVAEAETLLKRRPTT